ncbi:MAG: AAA family ATPase, partial [Acidobacteria bacterium]|nr:AAA family ATPase [Acidobacteriota bacterium]
SAPAALASPAALAICLPRLPERSSEPNCDFEVGDRVCASDRGNFGTITDLTETGAMVQFVNPEDGNTATKFFPFQELSPATTSQSYRETDWEGATPFPTHLIGDPDNWPDVEDPPAWIEGLIEWGYVCAFGKWKESKKTIFLTAAAYAIASGKPFLGRSSRQARVAWVQRDMPLGRFNTYARRIFKGAGYEKAPVHVINAPMDLTEEEDRARFLKTLKALESQVVFLDSFSTISAGLDEDRAKEVKPFISNFINGQLRDAHAISVVLIGHPPKGSLDSPGGSRYIASGADSLLRFVPSEKQKHDKGSAYVTVEVWGRHPDDWVSFRLDASDQESWKLEVVSGEEVQKDHHQKALDKTRALARALWTWREEKPPAKSALMKRAREAFGLCCKTDAEQALVEEFTFQFESVRRREDGNATRYEIADKSWFCRDFKNVFGSDIEDDEKLKEYFSQAREK